jgi:Enoyl-(Acyl carrier protein) reductase
MSQSDNPEAQPSVRDVALIVGGGPGISSSCARLFAQSGMRVGIAARTPDKPVLQNLEKTHGVCRYACDAGEPAAVELLFQNVVRDLGAPTLVVHNIDGRMAGILRKGLPKPTRVWCSTPFGTRRSARSWWVSRQRGSCVKTSSTPMARRERSSSRTPAQRSKDFRRAVPLRWHVMRNRDSRRAWRGSCAAGHPHRACAHRRRDRLDTAGRGPRAPIGGNGSRRQHGRP